MHAQDIIDLLRLYGWPTETEKYIDVTEIFFHFAKGTEFNWDSSTRYPYFLRSTFSPYPLMYGEDSLCFPKQNKK